MSQDIQEDLFKIVAAPMPEEVGYSYREEALSYIKNNSTARIVIDYIAGMTDNFFNYQYKKYFNK